MRSAQEPSICGHYTCDAPPSPTEYTTHIYIYSLIVLRIWWSLVTLLILCIYKLIYSIIINNMKLSCYTGFRSYSQSRFIHSSLVSSFHFLLFSRFIVVSFHCCISLSNFCFISSLVSLFNFQL